MRHYQRGRNLTEDMGNPNLKPQSEMLYLLGSIDAKGGGLQSEVSGVKTTLDKELTAVKRDISVLRSDVDVLQSKQKPYAPWWSIAAGLAAVTTLVLFIAQYFGSGNAHP